MDDEIEDDAEQTWHQLRAVLDGEDTFLTEQEQAAIERRYRLGAAVEAERGNRYRHYKGGAYYMVCVALRESDGEQMAVYRNEESGTCITRPMSEFTEVLGDDKEGTHFYRFERIT
jgi:hypothetical protein